MRLAISNIAWEVSEDEQIAALLGKYRIDAIDVAPSKYFSDPHNTKESEIIRVRDWWSGHGIDITGMQSLLFGTTGLKIFATGKSRTAMLKHLEAICRIGSGLGATRLVFGSPKNRDRLQLSNQEVEEIAICFFRSLGDIASRHGVVICLEPNPACYGANFMINSSETAAIVSAVGHPSIKMQLDTGALTINEENFALVIKDYVDIIGHIHASEPDLVPLGSGCTAHAEIGKILWEYLPESIVSIEMLTTSERNNLDPIEAALETAVLHYRVITGDDKGIAI